jgi:hypothetical protein
LDDAPACTASLLKAQRLNNASLKRTIRNNLKIHAPGIRRRKQHALHEAQDAEIG